MKLSEIGEGGLLDLLTEWTGGASGAVRLGVGDDAALLDPTGSRQLVISTDAWIDGVHFSRDYLSADEIGHRVMAGSLSDLAAMGADGLAAFVNVHAPPDTPVSFLRGVYQGMERVAGPTGVVIAGGDTVRGELAFDVTVVGTVEMGEAVRRDGAREGDVICVSGSLGGSEAGRRSLAGELDGPLPRALREEAESAHKLPRPRFDVAKMLTTLERRTVDVERERETVERVRPTAMMDLSDGLSGDLLRLCEASHVGCRLEGSQIPMSAAARRVSRLHCEREIDLALAGGEDFELLFTLRPEDVDLMHDAARKANLTVTSIGAITPFREGRRMVLPEGSTVELRDLGWDHFRESRTETPPRTGR